jgi:alkylation response protein AidB-like acyl-CoA dehydrogenase
VTAGAPADLPEVRERAAAACRKVLAAFPADGGGGQLDEAIGAALTAFAEAGLFDLGFLHPEASTVDGRDMRRAAAAMEAIAGQSGWLASTYLVTLVVAGACVVIAGSPAQKSDLVPRLRGGKLQLAFALTEPDAGSDAAALTTTARPDGDGFRLTGEKIYTTGAATADHLLVVARVAPAEDRRALTIFLVPGGAPSLSVEPLATLAGGPHTSCRVRLDGVRVEAADILGGPAALGKAWGVLRVTGTLERLMVSAQAAGLASAVVDRSVTFAMQRRQFGQPIAGFQAIQHALVEMRTIETGMRLFVDNALSALEAGGDATTAVCMAKYVCSEQLQRIVAMGMRVLGGRAFFEFEDMARYVREAPFTLYAGGTVEIQKLLIARQMGLMADQR